MFLKAISRSEFSIVSLVVILMTAVLLMPIFSTTFIVTASLKPEATTKAVTPCLQPLNRTTEIESILLKMNDGLFAKYTQELQDFKTRYSYRVDKCLKVSEYIYNIFKTNGLTTTYDPFDYKDYNMRNVVGEKPGSSTSDSVFIICSHYDSISGSAWANAPGADDNGSGTAAVLAAAEVLSDYEFNYTIRFVTFAGEEQGLKGSAHYANGLKNAGENVSGVINLDMIAYNPDPGSSLVVINRNTCPYTLDLANYTSQIANKYQSITYLDVEVFAVTGNSDHASFGPQYKGIHLFEDNFNPNYHSGLDTVERCNMTYCANISQIAIATIAELAELNSTDSAPPAHSPGYPTPNSHSSEHPTISIEITDPSSLDISSLKMWVNGTLITPMYTPTPLGYNFSFVPPVPFADGNIVNVTITITDTLGYVMNYSWEFTIDAVVPGPPTNPQISVTQIEMEKQGVAINVDAPGIDDRRAWSPTVIYLDGEYKMWYSAMNMSSYHIAYANSSNGLVWNKYGVVLTRGATGEPDGAYPLYPSVIYEDGEYKMWYSGSNGSNCRILYANSTDGINWIKQGLAFNLGQSSCYDTTHCYTPSVLKTTEYEMWYTGFNGDDHWLLYANSSNGINWTKHPAPLFMRETDLRYSVGRIAHLSIGFDGVLYHMWYTGYDGIKYRILYANSTYGIKWDTRGLAVDAGQTTAEYDYIGSMFPSNPIFRPNETKLWYSAYGSDGYYRIIYANLTTHVNKTDLEVSWDTSSSDDVRHYEVCRANNISELSPWQTYLRFNTTAFVENEVGDENETNYYYRVRAVDKVGHITECTNILGKIGNAATSGWNLIANPFIVGNSALDIPLDTIRWDAARVYDGFDPTNPWKSNITGKPDQLNSLNYINQTMGIWAHVYTPEVYVSTGIVKNITMNLQAGWNLVAYPYHEIKTVSSALAGLPWDTVEEFDPGAPYHTSVMSAADPMDPGTGYWIHLTSAAVWEATNL